jgi:chromosome segregation ATPase
VIEYALLFALGFLAATLAGLLVAPAIQRRIVAYTENRMKATMPLSPQEVRAQTDMARAAFAAENARVSQKLVREREKSTQLAVKNEALKRDASRLAGDNADLKAQIEEMNVGAGDLRSALRHEDEKFARLKAQLESAEREILHKKREIEILNANRDLLQTDLNDGMIALAARETEIENLKSRLLALRHEREKLLEGLRAAQGNLKETVLKLAREEGRSRQLETKLSREISQSAGKDTALERRAAEIGRLREKLRGVAVDTKASARQSRPPEAKPLFAAPPETPQIELTNGAEPMNGANGMDIPSLEADVGGGGGGVGGETV